MAAALGVDDAPLALHAFNQQLGVPLALRDLGMPEAGIAHAVTLAGRSPYWNPRPLERAALLGLVRRVCAGDAPQPT